MMLQPEDSKRIADAIIARLDDGEFDIRDGIQLAIAHSLNDGMGRDGFGAALLDTVDRAIIRGIENTIGSKEAGDIFRDAIERGITSQYAPKP